MKFGSTLARVALGLGVALAGGSVWVGARAAHADPRAQAVASGVAAQEMGQAQAGEGSGPKYAGAQKTLPLGNSFEITAGTNGLFSLSDVSTQVSLFAEARYRFTSLVQLGGSFAYRYQSSNSVSDSAFQGLVGPTLNLGLGEEGSIQNAYFISALAGITTGQSSFGNVVVNSNTEPTVALSIGKRFEITKQIAYAPSVGVVKELYFDPNFTIQPISFSIFF
jgi:hypothetical protein